MQAREWKREKKERRRDEDEDLGQFMERFSDFQLI